MKQQESRAENRLLANGWVCVLVAASGGHTLKMNTVGNYINTNILCRLCGFRVEVFIEKVAECSVRSKKQS